jgi:hypothetical protein
VLLAVLIGAAAWALTQGPASALVGTPIVHGSALSSPQCKPAVETRQIEDFFDGGGTVLRYLDGARCTFAFTIQNRSGAAITIAAVERTDPDMAPPLRFVGATRGRGPNNTVVRCIICPKDQVEFSPFVMAPGEEWSIAVRGLMAGSCAPPRDYTGGIGFSTVDVTVRTLGVNRVVPVPLENPILVETGECLSTP